MVMMRKYPGLDSKLRQQLVHLQKISIVYYQSISKVSSSIAVALKEGIMRFFRKSNIGWMLFQASYLYSFNCPIDCSSRGELRLIYRQIRKRKNEEGAFTSAVLGYSTTLLMLVGGYQILPRRDVIHSMSHLIRCQSRKALFAQRASASSN